MYIVYILYILARDYYFFFIIIIYFNLNPFIYTRLPLELKLGKWWKIN